MKKPKCYLCEEAGNNDADHSLYLWVERRGGGELAHLDCYARISHEIHKNKESKTYDSLKSIREKEIVISEKSVHFLAQQLLEIKKGENMEISDREGLKIIFIIK